MQRNCEPLKANPAHRGEAVSGVWRLRLAILQPTSARVLFIEARFAYLVRDGSTKTLSQTTARHGLTRAASGLYRSVTSSGSRPMTTAGAGPSHSPVSLASCFASLSSNSRIRASSSSYSLIAPRDAMASMICLPTSTDISVLRYCPAPFVAPSGSYCAHSSEKH